MDQNVVLFIDDKLKSYKIDYYPGIIEARMYLQNKPSDAQQAMHQIADYGDILVDVANYDISYLIDRFPWPKETDNHDDLKKILLENIQLLPIADIIPDSSPLFNLFLAMIDKALYYMDAGLEAGNAEDARGVGKYELMYVKYAHILARQICTAASGGASTEPEYSSVTLPCNITLGENNILTMNYEIKNLQSLVMLDYLKIYNANIPVKVCENCGKYFIPRIRSDEKYCNYQFKNGKSCKETGYEIKLKGDIFKTAYRKAYKTQHARIRYNNHISDYEEKHFRPWEVAAKKALTEYNDKNDIEGFEKWLKDNRDSF